MKLLIFLFLSVSTLLAQVKFSDYFTEGALRLDIIEAGNNKSESIFFNSIKKEPYFSGSHNNLIDTLDLGYYYFYLYSLKDSKLIFSKGFSTLFQEWQSTEEASKINRALNYSLRFPVPKDSVKLVIKKRNRENVFHKLFSYKIHPTTDFIDDEVVDTSGVFKIFHSGNYGKRLDILFLPEGYTKSDSLKYRNDCNRFMNFLFTYSPFSEMKNKINIWGINKFSEEEGADIPGKNIYCKTLLNSSYYTFGSERYLMVNNYFKLADVAAAVPYDQIFILVNAKKYGGGAIYNFYSTVAAQNKKAELVFVHEFGHGLAGLADEYYTSDVSYENYYDTKTEPWEKNITTLVNFNKKWKNLVDKTTPVPTPQDSMYYDKIGVFEGAGYVAKGVYRSSFNSIMKSLSAKGFNVVSKNAIINVIKFFSE